MKCTHSFIAYSLLFFLFNSLSPQAYAKDEEHEGEEQELEELQEIREGLEEFLDSEDGKELKIFVAQKISPEAWKLIERESINDPWLARGRLEDLAMICEEYEFLSDEAPVEAERFLSVQRREIQTYVIAAKIEQLESSDADVATIDEQKKLLRSALESSFDQRLKTQKEDLNSLQEELEELKTYYDQRIKNRDKIIEKRMKELLGDRDPLEW